MATSSIYTDVKVKSVSGSRKLVNALENAQKKNAIEVNFSRPVNELKGEAIKALFETESK